MPISIGHLVFSDKDQNPVEEKKLPCDKNCNFHAITNMRVSVAAFSQPESATNTEK